MLLDPVLAQDLLRLRDALLAKDELIPEARLDTYYATFRERFGPQVLSGLDGLRLLETLHGRGTKDSLVYWLEYKNDEELPAIFGSIAGGSAAKFGLFKKAETGQWQTGTRTPQDVITEAQAVELARAQRDQLLAAADLLAPLAPSPQDLDSEALQSRLAELAPDLVQSAWFHKYLSLVFPTLVDDFHSEAWQRFHLVKSLQVPPKAKGRFVCAGPLMAMARELDMPFNHLSRVLNERNGAPHGWWRVGTRASGDKDSQWPAMRDGGFMAIGWPKLGPQADLTPDEAGRELLRARLNEQYPGQDPRPTGNSVTQILDFVAKAPTGDIVLACDGATVLGVGRILGDYTYVEGEAFPHHRPVEWLDTDAWPMQVHEGLRTRFVPMRKHPENLVEAERRILHAGTAPEPAPSTTARPPQLLTGLAGRIQEVLQRKGQVILYGPPGTGKTHHAQGTLRELAARGWHGKAWAALTDQEQSALEEAATATCTFHPGYGYEDFIEGYRPEERDGALVFVRRDGLFKQLCARAQARPDKPFFLLIDEINRGDIPRIFGELITLLERPRRGEVLHLAQSGDRFSVPENLYVVGTMNTADRSIALLDAALRRRFGFVELLPDPEVLGTASVAGIPLGPWLAELNRRILRFVGRDARNLQVGHAYLLHAGRPVTDPRRFAQVLRDDVIPLIEEYCYEDYDALKEILGPRLVDLEAQRIDQSLFRPERLQALVEALLEPTPDLLTSAAAVLADSEPEGDPDDDPEGDDVTDEAA